MSAQIRVLAVTGASRGIGAAVAQLGAQRGFRVALGYRTERGLAEGLAAELTREGASAMAVQLDVANSVSVEAFFDRVCHAYGGLDAVAHCAGIAGMRGNLLDMRPGDLAAPVQVNLLGAMHCVQAAARRMIRSRGGRGGSIVLLSSEAARFGGNRISPYAASKAGLNTFAVGAARELAVDGVRLNVVSPGVIDTDQQAGLDATQRAALLASIPLGRMGTAEEVAYAVLWLLSDEAGYVAGSVLTVAGGR